MAENKRAVDVEISFTEKILLFFVWHICFVPPIAFVSILFHAPLAVKVQAILLYVLFVFWSGCSFGCELKAGKPWKKYSQDFYAFRILRSYLDLSFGPLPKELVDAEKKDGAQFVFAVYPHGCGSEFRILMEGVLHEVLPNVHSKVRTLAASVLFVIPFIREISLWTGCIDARRKVAEQNIDRGNSLLILPGGESEQIHTEHGKEKVYLKSRKGFIKLAMRKRVPVVPMYVFGSSDSYYTSKLLFGARYMLMKTGGVCLPLNRGLFGSPLCPLPKRNTIIFGSPLTFDMKGSEPTDKELDKAHDLFIQELKALFDKQKSACGYHDRELEIM